MQIINGGVTAPAGFKTAGVHANIKGKGGTKKDVALLVASAPCTAAGVYTLSEVKAAPVLLSQELTASGRLQAVVMNSGNANACTGQQGLQDAKTMTEVAGEALGLDPKLVGVASTGVIGVNLPMDRVIAGIKAAAAVVMAGPVAEVAATADDTATAAATTFGPDAAAEAIMTTDTFPKQVALRFDLNGTPITIGAMAKGSGMIHPNMGTMLGFVTTDAAIAPDALLAALRAATDLSYNMITVDGDTSTNDQVILLANGVAGNEPITLGTPAYETFTAALTEAMTILAKAIARDGEGATKLIEVQVKGAASEAAARAIAKTIVGSSLVKAAAFGADANWGRIIAAAGRAGVPINQFTVTITMGEILVLQDSTPVPFDEELALAYLKGDSILFTVDLKMGEAAATAWGCDLTYDYVKINGSYRT
ncbi:MAG TPA: bifunctional glutamate N-acetyltransferase/amino-acid acetyltransferase ArgJ [Symbiobacteriaceae bacterium]|nr:bifunctional glutamate N-acetyltransferase/amino-acid acetyltransferase ArgJ [Symbiobacteriaceae bacterium]